MGRRTDKDLHRIFRALSVETRVRIVEILCERAVCVGALSRILGVSSGAVSQHLRILKDAGLVEADRRGYFIHYRVTPAARKRAEDALRRLFGKGTTTAKSNLKKGANVCAAKRRSARSRKT